MEKNYLYIQTSFIDTISKNTKSRQAHVAQNILFGGFPVKF